MPRWIGKLGLFRTVSDILPAVVINMISVQERFGVLTRLCFVVFVGVWTVFSLSSSVEAQQSTATITSVQGEVLIFRQGETQMPGTVGVILREGDVVQTQDGAMVLLRLADGSTLELGENTKMDITELVEVSDTGARVSRVRLLWGRLRTLLSPRHQTTGSSFTFETPNALAGVRFSEPDYEIVYNPDMEMTVFLAHRSDAEMTHRVTQDELLISQGHIGIAYKDLLQTIMMSPRIHFETDRVYLNKNERLQLDGFAAFLNGFPDVNVLIEGHADSTGGEAKNQLLSQRRAENVKYYLVTRHRIAERRFTLHAYGSMKPVDTNDTEEGRAHNRRVDISWEVLKMLEELTH